MSGVLRLNLVVPEVRAGGLTPGDFLGVHLSDVLLASGVLAGVPQSDPGGLLYPLAIPDGGEVAIPAPIPFLGRVELVIGNDGGRLRVVVPSVPLLLNPIQKSLQPWTVGGPSQVVGGTAFWLHLEPGSRASWNLGMLGELAVVVPR